MEAHRNAGLFERLRRRFDGFIALHFFSADVEQADARAVETKDDLRIRLAKNGEVDELKWVEIDGLTGVQFREANPEKPDGIRRLQWLAYRKYLGQVQMINLMLSSEGKDFDRHKDAMYGILYSTKITH